MSGLERQREERKLCTPFLDNPFDSLKKLALAPFGGGTPVDAQRQNKHRDTVVKVHKGQGFPGYGGGRGAGFKGGANSKGVRGGKHAVGRSVLTSFSESWDSTRVLAFGSDLFSGSEGGGGEVGAEGGDRQSHSTSRANSVASSGSTVASPNKKTTKDDSSDKESVCNDCSARGSVAYGRYYNSK